MLTIPVALSAFTHIWNPVGFPSVYIDEDAYMQRAMIVLEGGGPRDTSFQYDHPYFGQLFLATIFRIIDYPDSLVHLSAQGDVHSIEMLHLIPRVLMGILAVIDTFLIYKISERRYNRNVALIASVLFAVMPMTWLLRRILLDSILLPFLLSSILFALCAKGSKNKSTKNPVILLSGIFLGLAIFTKIPAFTMIPLIGFLIYTNINNRNLKMLGFWFIPVIIIPLIWPAHALYVGEFDDWLNGIHYQTHRNPVNEHLQSVTGIGSIFDTMIVLFQIDPVLIIAGLAGVFFFAIIKRDFLFLLWVVPLLFFLYFVGFVQYFYLIPLLPAFCIAAAKMINDLSNKVGKKKIQQKITKYFDTGDFWQRKSLFFGISNQLKEVFFGLFLPSLPIMIVSGIGIFGLISTIMLLTTNLNTYYFEALAFVDKYLSHNTSASNNYRNDLTIISDFRYTWIPQYVTHQNYYYKRFWDSYPIKTEKVFLIFQDDFVDSFLTNTFDLGKENIRGDAVYNNTLKIAAFKANSGDVYDHHIYPYTSLSLNTLPQKIEMRTNVLLLNSSDFVLPINNGTTVARVNHTLEIAIPSIQLKLPSFWNDPFKNCDHDFKCVVNSTTGWNNIKTSFQLSTNTTNGNTWSWIYGKDISVNSGERYKLITHMKLNEFARGSHVAMEGYNETSKRWNQLTQCPSGTDGPLEWHEFSCNITIPKDTTKIRPILNAGWSSQPNTEAVTLFDAININKIYPIETSNTSTNMVSNANFIYFDDGLVDSGNSTKIISLCSLKGDFDVQIHYKILELPPVNGVKISLIAQTASNNKTYDNTAESIEQINADSHIPSGQLGELHIIHFNSGINLINSSHLINTTKDISGRFRMIRSGYITTGYYYSFGRWIPIHSEHAGQMDVNIILQARAFHHGFEHRPVKISLISYAINKGHQVNCQTK